MQEDRPPNPALGLMATRSSSRNPSPAVTPRKRFGMSPLLAPRKQKRLTPNGKFLMVSLPIPRLRAVHARALADPQFSRLARSCPRRRRARQRTSRSARRRRPPPARPRRGRSGARPRSHLRGEQRPWPRRRPLRPKPRRKSSGGRPRTRKRAERSKQWRGPGRPKPPPPRVARLSQ